MSNGYLNNAGVFLIQTLFGLYILALMLRLLLGAVRADPYNPVSQFVLKITNPIILPVRRFVPAIGRLDTATVLWLLALQTLELFIILSLRGYPAPIAGLVLLAAAELLGLLLNIFLVTILIEVVLSWINPGAYNPVAAAIYQLNEPVLRPARRFVPPISGLDLSPLVVIVGIQLLKMLLHAPLADLSYGLL